MIGAAFDRGIVAERDAEQIRFTLGKHAGYARRAALRIHDLVANAHIAHWFPATRREDARLEAECLAEAHIIGEQRTKAVPLQCREPGHAASLIPAQFSDEIRRLLRDLDAGPALDIVQQCLDPAARLNRSDLDAIERGRG